MFFFSLSLNTSVRWILPPKLVSKIIRPLQVALAALREQAGILRWTSPCAAADETYGDSGDLSKAAHFDAASRS
jgi:hypothetical protein